MVDLPGVQSLSPSVISLQHATCQRLHLSAATLFAVLAIATTKVTMVGLTMKIGSFMIRISCEDLLNCGEMPQHQGNAASFSVNMVSIGQSYGAYLIGTPLVNSSWIQCIAFSRA